MKKVTFIITVFSVFLYVNIFAQHSGNVKVKHGKKNIQVQTEVNNGNHKAKGFVDIDGDGYNDNAPDHDGDGIPNGLDPDFKKGHRMGRGFIDLDGDGINDNAGFGARKHGKDFSEAMKNHRKMLQNKMKNAAQMGFSHFNNGFNGMGFGFGFNGKFGQNHSGNSGNGTGTSDGNWNWNWNWHNGNNNGNGSGNGSGSGSGSGSGNGSSDGPWNWGWGHSGDHGNGSGNGSGSGSGSFGPWN